MEFIRQALLSAKILTPGGYISDAIISNNACVCDAHGKVTHKLSYAANGVDLVVSEYGSGRIVSFIKLPITS